MTQPNLKNIVAFCILMENNNGIVDKSPDYILEKFNRYVVKSANDEFEWGLDQPNNLKLRLWSVRWLREGIENE